MVQCCLLLKNSIYFMMSETQNYSRKYKNCLLMTFLFISFFSKADTEGWLPFETLYHSGGVTVEIQFKTYPNSCTIPKPNKFRYNIINPSSLNKTVYWELKFKDCNGNQVARQQEVTIGGENPTGLIESMDYTFTGTYISKRILQNITPILYILSGKITNSSGYAVKYAKVEIVGEKAIYTNSNGYYSIQIKSGQYKLRISASSHTSKNETVSVYANKTKNITLPKSTAAKPTTSKYTLSGRITNKATGLGLANARVEIIGLRSVYTDTYGSYSVVLSSGTYAVKAYKSGYQSLVTVNPIRLFSNYTQNFEMSVSTTNTNNNNSYSKRNTRSFSIGISYKLLSMSTQFGLEENQRMGSAINSYLGSTESSYFNLNLFYRSIGMYIGDINKISDTLQYNVGLYYSPFRSNKFYFKLGYTHSNMTDGWFHASNYANTPYSNTSIPLFLGAAYVRNFQQYEFGYNLKTNTFDVHVGVLMARVYQRPVPVFNQMKYWSNNTEDHNVLMWTSEKGTPLGISYVGLWGIDGDYDHWLQFYTDLRFNPHLFTGLGSFTHIDEEQPTVDYSTGENFTLLKSREGHLYYSLGVTIPFPSNVLPVWGYLGVGYGYNTQFDKMEYDDTLFDEKDNVWVHNQFYTYHDFFPEIGMYVSMFNESILLKLGTTLLLDENRTQVGIGYNFKD